MADILSPDSYDPANVARTLQVTLGEMPQPLFAVLDGALFDDLPGDLLGAGFSCRSLFLEHGDVEVERAGPWLFALNNERARAHAEALAIAQPCAVFWSCAEGEMALWRHLRTLNEVLIPLEGEAQGELTDAPSGQERVMFRHWDPNVLASVMPLLDASQFARVFGPSAYILINAPDHGGLRRIPRPDALPPAPHGPLRLSPEQMEGLKAAATRSSRDRIHRYLLDVAPNEASVLGEARMRDIVLLSEKTGKDLALESEQAYGRWSYVMVRTNGRALEQAGLREWISDGAGHPDEKMVLLLKSISHAEVGRS
jgi:hypothetical protein